MTDRIRFGEPMRAWQREAAGIKKRFIVLAIHRRAGKTELALKRLLNAAVKSKSELPTFYYIAPYFNQAKTIAWERLKKMTRPLVQSGAAKLNQSELTCTLASNGAIIRLFGADNPDSIRGSGIDGVVLDEVAQIKPELWFDGVRPALSDKLGWAWFIGTPKGVNLFSHLFYYAASSNDDDWGCARYTVYETEALTPDEVAKMKKELSETSFAREYLCDFTAAGDNQLINLADIEEASRRVLQFGSVDHAARIIGVDPARFGNDRSVIIRRQGLQAFEPIAFNGIDNMRLAEAVAREINRWKPDAVFVDAGAGSGVIDRLRQLGHSVMEVNFGGKASDDAYVNKRTQMWFDMRDWISAGGAIPNINSLKIELATPTYGYDAAGKFKLESKDEIKKRMPGGASPDIADALALTFAAHVSPKSGANLDNRPSYLIKNTYDPYADM